MALAIMALLVSFIGPQFEFIRKFYESNTRLDVETQLRINRIQAMRIFENLPLLPSMPDPKAAILKGNYDSIVALGYSSASLDQPVRIELQFSAKENDLAMKTYNTQSVPLNRILLRTNLDDCNFHYWDRTDAWLNAWSDKDYLPELIKIACIDLNRKQVIPIILQPGKFHTQTLRSRSSLVPPIAPSLP